MILHEIAIKWSDKKWRIKSREIVSSVTRWEGYLAIIEKLPNSIQTFKLGTLLCPIQHKPY